MRDYDEITSFLGEWGPFQKSVFILLSLSTVPNGYAGLAMVFISDTPPHHCTVAPSNGTPVVVDLNRSLPVESVNGELRYSRCSRYKVPGGPGAGIGNNTEGCIDGWEFSTERYTSTIVTEWNLVCEEGWKVPFSLSVFFMGVLMGSFMSGQISDRYGRKVILFITMALQTVFSLIQIASTSWEMFCILFFIVGIGQISNYVAAFVLGTELLGKSARIAFSTVGVCVFYGLGYAILPLCAYFIRSWKALLFALALPGFLYIPLWWLIPESPRWLLAQGRIKEAEAIIRSAAKKNSVTPPEVIFKAEDSIRLMRQNDTEVNQHSYTYFDLVKTTDMRNITILNILIWFVITISYFGLSLNTPNMNGDPYINCFASAAMEIVAYVAAWLLLRVAPRRTIISSTLLSGGTLLLLIQLVPSNLGILASVLAMVGKFGITAAFSVIYVSAVELFPTVVRSMGVGICSMASKIGSMISPFFAYMGAYNQVLPYILMGILTVSAGLLSLLLPETRGTDLPEDLTQVQKIVCCCSRRDPTSGLVLKDSYKINHKRASAQMNSLQSTSC
nr:PREDICTED: solute carrier family 22 member 5-like isoform X2 [Lepisosteus oculatus]